MALIYDLDELSHSGLDAMQTTQRDWSSYLVHFTSRVAMTSLKKALKQKQAINVDVVSSMLKESDEASLGQFKKILKDRTIRASAFDERNGSTRLVCLSECSLPGVFTLSCRYGRFGFVFHR